MIPGFFSSVQCVHLVHQFVGQCMICFVCNGYNRLEKLPILFLNSSSLFPCVALNEKMIAEIAVTLITSPELILISIQCTPFPTDSEAFNGTKNKLFWRARPADATVTPWNESTKMFAVVYEILFLITCLWFYKHFLSGCLCMFRCNYTAHLYHCDEAAMWNACQTIPINWWMVIWEPNSLVHFYYDSTLLRFHTTNHCNLNSNKSQLRSFRGQSCERFSTKFETLNWSNNVL